MIPIIHSLRDFFSSILYLHVPDPGNTNSPVVVVPLTKKSSPVKPQFTEQEVKAMSSKKYMDALVVPTLLKALAVTNKQVCH